MFLKYDGVHFDTYSEDNIQYQILTTISNEKHLMPWKRKINNNIIKQTKERSPLSAIPESATIQYVINSIYPSIFLTRNSAKYFLTIIGDCINSKTDNNLIYIISPSVKPILTEISNQCYTYFGITNCLNNIKYKYYDHEYDRCRLININPNLNINPNINLNLDLANNSGEYILDKSKLLTTFQGLIKNILDLLCVSSHYSLRYNSADGFLKQCSETKLVDFSLYLKNNTIDLIINKFIEKSLTPCVSSKIDTKNMLFLFKKFLDDKNIPNIAFHETLKTLFKEKLNYNEKEDSFNDITSTHLPVVSNFMKFWDSTIREDEFDEEPEIEIDDIFVTATRSVIAKENIAADVTTLNAEEILLAGMSTLPELLQRQPGIEISNNGGPGKVSTIGIRGTSSTHTIILIDGVRMNAATSGFTALEHIPLSQIEKIEIVRGAASSIYGQDAIGGVIQIFTKKGAEGFNPYLSIVMVDIKHLTLRQG